tara:strand:- start:389 stop:553 length:165 start_codon:yes stop_codon:yes gene_type:complete
MNVQIKTQDIEAVMASNPLMASQVEIQALRRTVGELEEEVNRLTSELKNGKKEK